MVVPLRESVDRATANSLALRLSRLSLSELLHNKGGVIVRERLVKGDSVRAIFSWGPGLPWVFLRLEFMLHVYMYSAVRGLVDSVSVGEIDLLFRKQLTHLAI